VEIMTPRRLTRAPRSARPGESTAAVARVLTIAAALLLCALPAFAFRIYLKDGTVVATKDMYRVEGDLALATLENGTQTTIRFSEIDVEKTDRLNQRAYTSAVVIEGGKERLLSLDDPAMRQKTLAEYVEERKRERADRSSGTATSSQQANVRRLRRTPAGYVDLRTLEKERVQGPATAQLEETLRRHGLGGAQLYRGTGPDRYLVELIADTEESVYRALGNLAATVLDLADAGLKVDALEVYMATQTGSRAGMFTLSEENAALLAGDQVDPAQFFVQFVEF
jgi:hypothetical protein